MSNKNEINNLRTEFFKYTEEEEYFMAGEIGQKLITLYQKDDTSYEYCIDLYNLAFVSEMLNKFSLCSKLCKKIIKILDKKEFDASNQLDMDNIKLLIDTYNNFAICYSSSSARLTFSINLLKKALILVRTYLPNDKSRAMDILHNLGCIYFDAEQYDKAISSHLEELALRGWSKNIHRSDNIFDLKYDFNLDYIDNLNFLGYSNEALPNFDEAIKYLSQSLILSRGLCGINSDEYIADLYYISFVFFKMIDYENALKYYKKTYELLSQNLNDDHSSFADILTRMAQSNLKLGNIDDALNLQIKSLNIIKGNVGENHIYYANSLKKVAGISYIIDDYKKALHFYEYENRIKKELIPIYTEDYVCSLLNLVNVHLKLSHIDEALEIANTILKMVDFDLPKDTYSTSVTTLCKVYLENNIINQVYELYENVKNNDIVTTFDDMIAKANSIDEDITDKQNKIDSICAVDDKNEDTLSENPEDIFNSIRNLFDNYAKNDSSLNDVRIDNDVQNNTHNDVQNDTSDDNDDLLNDNNDA